MTRALRRAFPSVNTGEVQVGPIKGWSDSDALFGTCNCLLPWLGAQAKYSKVIQRFGDEALLHAAVIHTRGRNH